MKSFLTYQLPALLWAGFIFALSSLPGSLFPRVWKGTDKLVHFFIFFILAKLLRRAFYHQARYRTLQVQSLLWAAGTAIFYGGTDELHQFLVPHRSPSLLDFLSDCLAASFFILWFRWRRRNNESEAKRDEKGQRQEI